jgi:hypothetical protein
VRSGAVAERRWPAGSADRGLLFTNAAQGRMASIARYGSAAASRAVINAVLYVCTKQPASRTRGLPSPQHVLWLRG